MKLVVRTFPYLLLCTVSSGFQTRLFHCLCLHHYRREYISSHYKYECKYILRRKSTITTSTQKSL